MKKIECFGEVCPIPLLLLQQALRRCKPGEQVMLVVDHSCVQENVLDYYRDWDPEVEEVMNGVWEITVTRR